MKAKAKALWRGLIRTLSGAGVAGLFVMAGYGFWMIPGKAGYEAAADCLLSIAVLCIAFTSMYMLGGGKPAQHRK